MRISRSQGRSRLLAMMVSVLTIAGSLVVMIEPSFGLATPTIAFLNPSSFATAGERGIIVSDAAPTAGPGCCEGSGEGYHLSAWVADAPPESRVFFSVVQRQVDIEITDTFPSTEDGSTWETNWRIPDELIDGPATLRAHLVLNEQQIAVDEVDVTILRLQDAARIAYPAAGGQFGMFAPLADGLTEGEAAARSAPIGVVDAHYYEDMDIDRLRVFYTTSVPGTTPKWTVCGTETLSGAVNGLRCTLTAASDMPNITAVAAVTNDSPPGGPYEARQNQSGDAVAIGDVYEQAPTTFQLTSPGAQRVNRETQASIFPCSATETVQLTDQVGRAIAGANIDVHATGPSDSLKFDHDSLELWTDVTAPDRGSHALEASYDCFTHPANSDPGEQGEHQRFGAPDRKHVESQAGGSSDLGRLSFALRSTAEGVTEWTAWVDETDDGCAANDDLFTLGELFVSGSIGWGQDPGFPVVQPYDTFLPCTPAPDPSPSPSEGEGDGTPLDGTRTISLRLEGSPTIGKAATFSGRIEAARRACERDQKVVLKMRRPNQRFWVVDRVRTDAFGRFTATAKAKVPRDYRAVAPATADCDRTRSKPVRLRAG